MAYPRARTDSTGQYSLFVARVGSVALAGFVLRRRKTPLRLVAPFGAKSRSSKECSRPACVL